MVHTNLKIGTLLFISILAHPLLSFAEGHKASIGATFNFVDTETSEQNVGGSLEIWPTSWLSIGSSREQTIFIVSERKTIQNSQPLYLRLVFWGLYLQSGEFESFQIHERAKSTSDGSDTADPGETEKYFATLRGTRSSVGYLLDLGYVLIGAGYYQTNVNEQTLEFKDGATRDIGGQNEGPEFSLYIAF